MSELTFRPATADDVPFLARVIMETSDGIVQHVVTGLIPFRKPEEIFAMVIAREGSHFHVSNMVVAEQAGKIVGMLFAYSADQQEIPTVMEKMLPKKKLEPVRPILTAAVPDTLYINTLWVDPEMRGQGVATALIDYANVWAKDKNLKGLSLHCWADNEGAIQLYSKHGFKPVQHLDPLAPLDAMHPKGSDIYTTL